MRSVGRSDKEPAWQNGHTTADETVVQSQQAVLLVLPLVVAVLPKHHKQVLLVAALVQQARSVRPPLFYRGAHQLSMFARELSRARFFRFLALSFSSCSQ